MEQTRASLPAANASLYFIGIGGISMSSLAVLAHRMGYRVSGSDLGSGALIDSLREEGIPVYGKHDPAQLKDADAVIYTAAISPGNPERRYAETSGIPCMTRAAFLGLLMCEYRVRIGISGTHGKSTTTGMVSAVYLAALADPTIVSGAVMPETGLAYRIGSHDAFLFEACEYTDSFLSFFPTTSVVLNVEMDHVDYFRSEEQLHTSFARYMDLADIAVVNADDGQIASILQKQPPHGRVVRFSATDASGADASARNITFSQGCASFDFCYAGKPLCRVSLRVPGKHNLANALAAATAAYVNGISPQAIADGLHAFRGAARRFEFKGKLPCGASVYDDYAHHPSEIRATVAAARAVGGRVRCVFQPHSYSRTVALFDGFVSAFSDADEVIFTDIYINLERERVAHELTSADLARAVPHGRYLPDFPSVASYLTETACQDDLILFMGAGNLYRAEELLPLQYDKK